MQTGVCGAHVPFRSQYSTIGGQAGPVHVEQVSPQALPEHGLVAVQPAWAVLHASSDRVSAPQSAPLQEQPPSPTQLFPSHAYPRKSVHAPSPLASMGAQLPGHGSGWKTHFPPMQSTKGQDVEPSGHGEHGTPGCGQSVGSLHCGSQSGFWALHVPLSSHHSTMAGQTWPGRQLVQTSPHALPAQGSTATQLACTFWQVARSGASPLHALPTHEQPTRAVHAEPSHRYPRIFSHDPSPFASWAAHSGGHPGTEKVH